MSRPVRAGRAAVVAGVLVAIYVVVLFLGRPVPDRIVALFGGPEGELARYGGLRVEYASPGQPPRTIEYPGLPEELVPEVTPLLVGGGLEMKEVVQTDFATRVGASEDVFVETEQWRAEGGGPVMTDVYLYAYSRDVLERAIADAAARGIELPPGHEIGFEHVEPDPSARDPRPFVRTYVLASDVLFDGDDVANAMRATDPYSGRPIVLLDFRRDAGERFYEVTKRLVGEKLAFLVGGTVRSAPIINSAIRGGRVSIAMSTGDPERQIREAEAIVAALLSRSAPPGGTITKQHWTPPADVGAQEWAARLLFGLVAGVLIALGTFFVMRWARPQWSAVVRLPGAFPMARLGVTLIAPIAVIVASRIALPGIDEIEVEYLGRGQFDVSFSIAALGVMPVITSFIVVELVAIAVPALRWRRHDPLGRVRLGQAVAVLAVLVALAQGYFAAVYLESLGRAGIVMETGWRLRLAVMATLAGTTMLFAVIAGIVREHGLGNGYGALLASGFVYQLIQSFRGDVGGAWDVATRGAGIGVVVIAGIAIATVCMLRWRVQGADREPAYRVPLSGWIPVNELAGLTHVMLVLFAFGLIEPVTDVWLDLQLLRERVWVFPLVLAIGAVAWAWIFARPRLIDRVALPAGLAAPTGVTWLRAVVAGGWILLVVGIAWKLATHALPDAMTIVEPLSWMLVTAVILDIVADARTRRADLVPAAVLHQIQHAGIVERVLADAGCPCHIHASHLRTLLAFFGPFAPAIVMVPREYGDKARELLAVTRA